MKKNREIVLHGSAWIVCRYEKNFYCCKRGWANTETIISTVGFRILLEDKNEEG